MNVFFSLLEQDHIVDARLLHLAAGFDLAERLKTDAIAS
jgi:hypothetical protein